jgi:hypothetical protein
MRHRPLCAAGLTMLMLCLPAAAALGQDDTPAPPPAPQPRWTIEGAAAFHTHYSGDMQSVAFGFAPTRNITVLVTAQRSHVEDRVQFFDDGFSAERGATDEIIGGEFRYAFLAHRRISPYVMGGFGGGTSQPNVSRVFPDIRKRNIAVLSYGGGARLPLTRWLDASIDVRFLMSTEARSDYFAVRMPVRAGLAVRF